MSKSWRRVRQRAALVSRVIGAIVALGAADPVDAYSQEQEQRPRKHYLLPALEIIGFDFALNMIDRALLGEDFRSDVESIRRNLRQRWVVENDPYMVNQFGHPFQGSIYHGFARSAGLNYWESAAYTFAGSILWEIAGETTPPSKNDQIASGIAGSFLGEGLFRVANLLLETSDGSPRFGRKLAVTLLSPPLTFNRGVFGNRFDQILDSRGAAYYRRWQLGASGTTQNVAGASTRLRRTEGLVDLSIEYGLPGMPGYAYARPFDYFAMQATFSSANGFENILTRGMLTGRSYEAGKGYRGIFGLYGSYDYIAPQIFRISTTALSLGTTAQWWPAANVAVQGSVLGGAGYAAVGTVHGAGERDYHYGIAPQALGAARIIFGDRASVDLTAREYFVSDVARGGSAGHDNIIRTESAFTVRLFRQNAIALRYLWSRRDAFYPDLGDRTQIRGTIGLLYTLLGHDRFGAIDWR
jgi:hypothetical protein